MPLLSRSAPFGAAVSAFTPRGVSRSLPAIALGLSALLAGCAGTPSLDQTPPTVSDVSTSPDTEKDDATKASDATKAPLMPSAFFAGDAERFEAWRCMPAQDLVTAFPQGELRLWSAYDAYRLTPAVVASGSRYVKGDLSFWEKGETAMVESDRGRLECERDQTRAALTRAQRPGVMFHGRGNEPGWTVRLAHDAPRLALLLDYGEREIEAPYRVTSLDNERGRVTLASGRADTPFKLELDARACFDSMSGKPFPVRVTLEVDGETYHGCGQGIAP
ncbi:MliC family protein [Halomonas salinarum]|uniref:MliC family protein n=1 Tax=Halomonas salinarum TaxID=1158993 RepID=UPI001438BF96|nr:MliC family protein [Halomonas salinarum]